MSYKYTITYRGMYRLITNNNKKLLLIMPVLSIPDAINKLKKITLQLEKHHYLIVYVDTNNIQHAKSLLIFERVFKNITIMISGKKKGLISAWNKPLEIGIEMLNPEYFCWVSDHDEFSDGYLKSLEILANKYNNADHLYVTKHKFQFYSNDVNHLIQNKNEIEKIKVFKLLDFKNTTNLYGKMIYGLFKIKNTLYKDNHTVGLRNSLFPDVLFIDSILINGGYSVIKFESSEGINFKDEIIKKNLSFEIIRKLQLDKIFETKVNLHSAILKSTFEIINILNSRWCILSEEKKISYLNLMYKKFSKNINL